MRKIQRVLNRKIYLFAVLLFVGWILGLMYYDVGAAIHILPVAGLFVVAVGQSRRKKIIDTR